MLGSRQELQFQAFFSSAVQYTQPATQILFDYQGAAQGYLPPSFIISCAPSHQTFNSVDSIQPRDKKKVGLGLKLEFYEGGWKVGNVKEGGPCDGKVAVDDILRSVNGIFLNGRSNAEIVNFTIGDQGSESKLGILRGSEEHFISVTRIFADADRSAALKRIDLGFKRRDITEIKKVFQRFAIGGHIVENQLVPALKEFDAVLDITEEDLKNGKRLLQLLDTNQDGVVDQDEFITAVQKSNKEIGWVRSLPLAELLEDAVDRLPGTNVPVDLADLDVTATADAFCSGLKRMLEDIKKQWESIEIKSTSSTSGGNLYCGKIHDFHEGLPPRIGHPHLMFEKAMFSEHCQGACARNRFTTTNTEITTWAEQEWKIVKQEIPCPADSSEKKKRRIPDIKETMQLTETKQAKLSEFECLAIILYSGPMYHIYNSILRQFPKEIYEFCKNANNVFTTTIHVLASAVQKLCRVTKIQPKSTLYRGLGLNSELPRDFFERDDSGCSGFTEWGFMSTTSKLDVAIEYSKVREGNLSPKVLVMKVWSVDRGACIKNFSQYPDEVEYLFLPCSFLENKGTPWLKSVDGKGVAMVPVRVNANLKAKTVEQFQEEKKGFHISAFGHLLREVEEELRQLAKDGSAQERLDADIETDKTNSSNYSVDGFLDRIVLDCQDVLNRHKLVPAKQYADSSTFRKLVLEMINTQSFAVSKLQEWLENKTSSFIRFRWKSPLRTAFRRRINFLRQEVAKAPEAETKSRLALSLCKTIGLIQESVEEFNELKETPLMCAAADGRPRWVVELLLDARAVVDAVRPDGVSAIWLAAQFGNEDAISSLIEGNASPQSPAHDLATPVFIAAQNGQAGCIELLHASKADIGSKNNSGSSPMDQAVMNKHENCTRLLSMISELSQGNQESLLELNAAAGPASAQEAGTKKLIIASGDISDFDGMMALAEYAKSGADVLFMMNYPAYVEVSSSQYDPDYAEQHPGLGYKYGADKIFGRDMGCRTAKYDKLLARYSESDGGVVDWNFVMMSAMTDVAFTLVTRVWTEVSPSSSRGNLMFGIGGVNSINPFSEKIIKNEVLLYSELLEDPSGLPKIKADVGTIYGQDGSIMTLNLKEYSEIFFDFCGSVAFWAEDWDHQFRSNGQGEGSIPDGVLKGAFVMGGVFSDKPPVTLPSIPGVLNRFSSATMNQLYHPEATGRFFSFLQEYSIPTFVVANNVVEDLTTYSATQADADKKVKTDEGITQFMEVNGLDGEFLNRLALTYYNSKSNPARKPFDFYCARVLTTYILKPDINLMENLKPMSLFYGSVCASTIVSAKERWDDAKAEYVNTVSRLTETGHIAVARKYETSVIKDMERKVVVKVYIAEFQPLLDKKKLELKFEAKGSPSQG